MPNVVAYWICLSESLLGKPDMQKNHHSIIAGFPAYSRLFNQTAVSSAYPNSDNIVEPPTNTSNFAKPADIRFITSPIREA
jgi:hypothetical protein